MQRFRVKVDVEVMAPEGVDEVKARDLVWAAVDGLVSTVEIVPGGSARVLRAKATEAVQPGGAT